MRFVIRGKKARGVPVLLSTDMLQSISLILKHRHDAGVPKTNPYVFGVNGNFGYLHLNACQIMREYSERCMASNPTILRGTQLRKYLATQSVFLALNDNEVGDLANFMGHAEKVHRDHYRLPVAAREIGRISQLLEIGIGQRKGKFTSKFHISSHLVICCFQNLYVRKFNQIKLIFVVSSKCGNSWKLIELVEKVN